MTNNLCDISHIKNDAGKHLFEMGARDVITKVERQAPQIKKQKTIKMNSYENNMIAKVT